MVRFMGVMLADGERLARALQTIYGIGSNRARELCFAIGATPSLKAGELHSYHLAQMYAIIERKYAVETKLRSIETANIDRLKAIRCYRGVRHNLGLPVRGQRTSSNAKTRKRMAARLKNG